jgi:ribosomal protein S18 acetylase RimI-like enzyme
VSDTPVLVRPGSVEDYSKAHEVIAETFTFHQRAASEYFRATSSPPPMRPAIERLLRDGQGAWLLAEHEGRIVGFVTIELRPAPDEPFMVPEVRATVDSLGILPAWRRRGIGRQLMAAAERWAREHGAQRLMLSVWEFNDGAKGLYDALGYTTFIHRMWKTL